MSLPLKLVGFERYMWLDDQPEQPMAYTIRMTCSGPLDAEKFEAAVEAALARHPLLHAFISGESTRKLTWVDAPGAKPYVDIAPEGEPLRCPEGERIDLREEIGVRIWVRTGDNSVRIVFQFHHTCCDGVGAYQFIEDLYCAYDHYVRGGSGDPPFKELKPELLKRRTRFGLSWWRVLLRFPVELWGMIVGFISFVLTWPVPLSTPKKPELSDEQLKTMPELVAHSFDNRQLKLLLASARARKTTLNDLVCRDVFLAMHAWNEALDPKTVRRNMRIMVPMNLRGPDDVALSAANVVGMAFLDRRPAWWIFGTPERLLRSIRLEMNFLKYFRLAIAYPRCCSVLTMLPGAARLLASFTGCWATSALSNMGRLFYGTVLPQAEGKVSFGNLRVEHVESAPPVRRGSSTSLGIHSYAGKFTLTMNYDRHHFTPEAADDLLAMMVQRIEKTIEEQEAETQGAEPRPTKPSAKATADAS